MFHKIIIVDDEPMICSLLINFLEALKYEVVVFNGGNQCVRYLKEGNDADLIISDMKMPDGDGMTILNHINNEKLNIPIFFMTGFSDFSQAQLLENGAKKVFTKPFKRKELVEEIKNELLNIKKAG